MSVYKDLSYPSHWLLLCSMNIAYVIVFTDSKLTDVTILQS